MKRIIKHLVVTAMLLTTVNTSLFASDTNNYSVAIEMARTAKAEALIDKVNSLRNSVIAYSIQIGDIAPTKTKVNAYFGLTDEAWKNYNGDPMTLNVDNLKITIDNLFTTTPSDEVQKTITTSTKLPPLSTISTNFTTLSTPLSAEYSTFYKMTQKIQSDSNAQVSTTTPTDTTKMWYQPNGKYGYDIFKYDTTESKWTSIGSASDALGSSRTIVVTDISELDNLSPIAGQTAMVSDGTTAEQYVYDGSAWVKTLSASSGGGMFNGTGNILSMATTLFDKAGGSVTESPAPNGEWAGSKTFTKKDDIESGGYWISDDNQFVVTKDITALNTLRDLFLTGTIAWIDNGNGGIYKLVKQTQPNGSILWTYQTQNYATLLNMNTVQSIDSDGSTIYITDHNEFVYYQNDQFNPINGNTYISKSSLGRNVFNPNSSGEYLIQTNDCTATTCNGDSTHGYYAGATKDGLYAFYYTTSGNQLNNLTDATPTSNWSDFWNNQISAIMWTGSQFGDVPTGAILVKITLNGNIAYTYSGNMINKANGYIIPQNKLPAGLTADTVTITKSGSTNYVNVSSLDNFVTDTNLDVDYSVNLTGSGFTNKKLKQCTPYGSNNLWSDDCSNPSSASVAVTNGSRSDLPAPSSTTRVNLTKQVGSEPNYTTNGVAYNSDNGYKQWFKSTSGTITNNMLDGIPCTGVGQKGCANAESVGHGIEPSLGYVQYSSIGSSGMKTWHNGSNVLKYNASAWGESISTLNNEIAGKAGNGLYYTKDNISPFTSTYTLQSEFGVTTWSGATMNYINDHDNSSNICASRGMRLPTIAETQGSSNPWGGNTYLPSGGSMGNSNGVPSNSHGYTWTASSFTSTASSYWIWNGSSTSSSYYNLNDYVRCVR